MLNNRGWKETILVIIPEHHHCSEGRVASSRTAQGDLRFTVGQLCSPSTAVLLLHPLQLFGCNDTLSCGKPLRFFKNNLTI